MAEITREEFKKIYDEKFVPMLEKLEPERVAILKKAKKWAFIVGISLFLIIGACFLFGFINSFSSGNEITIDLSAPLKVILPSVIVAFIVYSAISSPIRTKLKQEVIPKVLSMYGNLYFSPNTEVISLQEMKSLGLFPSATTKRTDDVIIGAHKGFNFVISESTLQHSEGSGKNRRTVTDFSGLVVKIQMKKHFTGATVVGEKGRVSKVRGFDKVELESVDFMKSRDVFATDQIEARYILTTAFIERLERLALFFSAERAKAEAKTKGLEFEPKNVQKQAQVSLPNIGVSIGGLSLNLGGLIGSNIVSASFKEGFAYLYIPSHENFFEVDIHKNLLNFEQYYKIYNELDSILSFVEHLNLDSKTGL